MTKALPRPSLPLLLAVVSSFGLVLALIGDGVADSIAAGALAVPFVVLARRLRWAPRA